VTNENNPMSNRNNKYYQTLLLTLTLLIVHSSLLIATVRFVSKTGSSTPPYITWETAADSIQKCINISVFGDTIYVANGVYEEQVVMIPGLSLIGSGADSCEINTINLVTSQNYRSVQTADSSSFTGFHIVVFNNSSWGIGIAVDGRSLVKSNKVTYANQGILNGSDALICNNNFINVTIGISLSNSNATVKNNFIYTDPNSTSTVIAGIDIEAFTNDYTPIIDSNYIENDNPRGNGINKALGSSPSINGNIIKLKGIANGAIALGIGGVSRVINNLIIAENGYNGVDGNGSTKVIINNYITGNLYSYGINHIGPGDTVKNNVVTNCGGGIAIWNNQNITIQYNNTWKNGINYAGFTPDTTNLSVDPMVVNDDATQGDLDFRLQMYSPLIDAGDPTILDRDGSRSDIGLYGGPYGWTYTYEDLAPRPPHNVTAAIEDGFVKLTWNKNTEADFSHYRVYRDTVSILIYDSTKIIGETVDTFYYDNLPPVNHETRFYYVITAFDNQGNQSYPSEEINVLVTGLGEYPPKGYDGYRLLANYPNPFNPSTKIPYRLKERGHVRLSIYDLKGELVRILVNEWQERGYYEVVFQPNGEDRKRITKFEVPMGKTYSDLSSGMYIYMIQVVNENNIPVFTDSEKMILLK
jgi:hypothetical protein